MDWVCGWLVCGVWVCVCVVVLFVDGVFVSGVVVLVVDGVELFDVLSGFFFFLAGALRLRP